MTGEPCTRCDVSCTTEVLTTTLLLLLGTIRTGVLDTFSLLLDMYATVLVSSLTVLEDVRVGWTELVASTLVLVSQM